MTETRLHLPPEIQGPSAWYGPELASRGNWLEFLSPAEIEEVEYAAKGLDSESTDIVGIRREHFPLPTLGPRLKSLLDEVLNGRGFVLLRALPVERWTMQQAAIAFFGIGSHLGAARSQNARGHVLGHVKDLGRSSEDPEVRIYQTHERQTYHTDSSDIVCLLCLRPARAGGLSSVVSSVTIFNEMRRRRPDLLKVLFEPIETDRRGEVPQGRKPYFNIPVFSWYEGLLSAIYQRQYIESARRFEGVPALTSAQIEALDLFDSLANDPALHLLMAFQPGDIQIVHNHTILHDRTAFEDWPDPERKRHLLRLWLAPENARPLPPVFSERFGSVIPGERGGVLVSDTRLSAPLEP
ncbi:MAG: taurine catabolism dioxygenase TauD [Blastocatellia bacterium AA13]|nr:MAG: taurine catabolism dioxygenase TauD [Blastocatellia bacterium AA13]